MKIEWAKKHWYQLSIFSVLFIGLTILLIQSLPFYDIHTFDFTNVARVRITDRGLLGNAEIEIRDSETIKKITGLLKSAAKVKQLDVNMKANQGLCDVDLICKNNRTKAISVTKTTFNGGIISSGQHYYRSDSLLFVIIQKLKE